MKRKIIFGPQGELIEVEVHAELRKKLDAWTRLPAAERRAKSEEIMREVCEATGKTEFWFIRHRNDLKKIAEALR